MNTNKMLDKKARWELHKDAVYYFEKNPEISTLYEQQLYGHWLPILQTIQVRKAQCAGHCWRNKNKTYVAFSDGILHMDTPVLINQ